jgi:hypothetical protein
MTMKPHKPAAGGTILGEHDDKHRALLGVNSLLASPKG